LASNDDLAEEAVLRFCDKFGKYIKSLSRRERQIIAGFLSEAMDPIERAYWRDPRGVLNTEEIAFLRNLLLEKETRA
jgi:hypothetical protein